MTQYQCDTAIIGGGLAGIVAALELLEKGQRVIIVERDSRQNFGGLARWAFGGMALVGTPEQNRQGIHDSPDIALSDWHSFANFTEEDIWPKKWAEYYVNESVRDVYQFVKDRGMKFLPAVNWVERGLYGPGNSLPRYHLLWGTGRYLIDVLAESLKSYERAGKLTILTEHHVLDIDYDARGVSGCHGKQCQGLEPGSGDEFSVSAENTLVATGGINGNLDKVRENWYAPWGAPPKIMLNGSHPFADGAMHDAVQSAGGNVTHLDYMWNYAAGIPHPQPQFPNHGLSLIPCKGALWMNYQGKRIGPDPLVTGFDTNYLCKRVAVQEKSYTWQLCNWKIAAKEFAISGSEHNPNMRDRKFLHFAKDIILGNPRLLRQMQAESDHFIVADTLSDLVRKMNKLNGNDDVKLDVIEREIKAYDDIIARGKGQWNDDQIRRIVHARQWRSDKLRTSKPTAILDPKAGPLIAIKEYLITRKSLGGIQTNLNSQVLNASGEAIPGLYATGEAAGFGGGGASGFRSLEGTFLSGCIMTSRVAVRSITNQQ